MLMLKDHSIALLVRATQGIMNRQAEDAAPLLARNRFLVIAPHPDDETLGCGGLILQARERGHEVRIVIVSDGAQGAKAGKAPIPELADTRKKEAREAASRLGVGPTNLVFLDLPDGALADCASELDLKLAEHISAFAPDLILSPYLREKHPDHRAIAESVRRLRDQDSENREWIEYPVWFWPQGALSCLFSRSERDLRLLKLDLSSVRNKKKHALNAYKSQLPVESESSAATGYFKPKTFLASFLGQYEYYISRHLPREIGL